jgi:D-inositol-3-phosphate glycosyltransferase
MAIRRVAMVSMHTPPTALPGTADAGGMNVAILGIAAELATHQVEVDLVTRAAGPPTTTELLPGVTQLELAAGVPGSVPKGLLPQYTDEFGEAVADLARRVPGGYDVIHPHYWLSGIASLPVSLELGIPLVQSYHSVAAMKNAALDPDGTPEPELRVRSEAFLARQADAVVATSSAEAGVLIDEAGAPADRMWIIPPGVDLAMFAPTSPDAQAAVRRMLGLESDRPIVVIAGRIQPLKGHELAVRALAELRTLRGWSPLLVVAGEVAPGAQGFAALLRELASELGVSGDVRYVGALHRDTLAELLAAASVTIVPSLSETFGLVALESAAAGTPVIAYRTGGLAESVAEGVSGLLLGTRDVRYWATEIVGLIENDERRSTLALSARAWAERFTWGSAAASLLGVYAGIQRQPAAGLP